MMSRIFQRACAQIIALCYHLALAVADPPNTASSLPASITDITRLANRDVLPRTVCGFWLNDGQNLEVVSTTASKGNLFREHEFILIDFSLVLVVYKRPALRYSYLCNSKRRFLPVRVTRSIYLILRL